MKVFLQSQGLVLFNFSEFLSEKDLTYALNSDLSGG